MDPVLPDVQLSRYRLERPLGAGGMGAVYLAHDLSLDRQVAIKLISSERSGEGVARRRLVREARAAAALDHPNICTVFEVIDEAGSPAAIVMQYVEGQTLASRLSSGRLDLRSALNVISEVAAALAHAHSRGIIHRDLKPQNIIVTPDGRAKLLDFGIARLTEPPGPSDDITTASRLTGTGDTPGTPAYMSPEQVDGRALDRRSDLFALGAVLFECLTGARAFKGRNAMEIASRIISYDPPPPSSLRPELTEGHDEICRRLIAKDPRDRFNSADELLGALQLLSTGTLQRQGGQGAEGRRSNWKWMAGIAAVLVLFAGFAAWRWRAPSARLPEDPRAADWYRRGTEAIREGLPHSARLALNEVINVVPDYAPAYIRLAEAEIELDNADAAQEALLRVDDLVDDESRLALEDRTRVRAVRALMLRDLDTAVDAYRSLAKREPTDPGAWLDVGRALDASGLRSDARTSYETALQINADYAPAHLRRGSILSLEGRLDEALAAFDEAERLYRAAANVEGEVEALVRRGIVLNGSGELRAAREALVRARDLATNLESRAQQIRAELTLSSVIASEGNWQEAQKMATQAVDAALRQELESVAADGLIELAVTLQYQRKRTEADAHLARAVELAERRGARTIAARATLQRASVLLDSGKPADALALARGPLDHFRTNRHRRFELSALTVMARAHEALGQYAEARTLAEQSLQAAIRMNDQRLVGEALENLAGQANALGALPEALDYRTRRLEIHRRLEDLSNVGFDLTNTADLLIRLGRHAEGLRLLDEIDSGVAKKIEAYQPRARRAQALRAISAAIQNEFAEMRRHTESLAVHGGKPDSNTQLTAVLQRYAGEPKTAARSSELLGSATSSIGREVRYWDLLGKLTRGQLRAALAGAEETFSDKDSSRSQEFEWRIAAVAAAAAGELREGERYRRYRERAEAALNRLRREWKSGLDTYEARPDLAALIRKAGLNQRS